LTPHLEASARSCKDSRSSGQSSFAESMAVMLPCPVLDCPTAQPHILRCTPDKHARPSQLNALPYLVAGMQVPIIAPVKQKKLEVNEQASLPTFYSSEFLAGLMTNPELVRNVAVIGHLHHGKSLVSVVAASGLPC